MNLEYEIVQRDKQWIVGLMVRTDNEHAMRDIPTLCEDFQDGWQEKIRDCVNDDIVCAYMEYDEDYTKPYTYIIGCIVKNINNIPAGMVSKELAAGRYAKVEVFGLYPESLLAAWEDIWDSDLDRAFTTDYEVYDQYFIEDNDYYFNIYISLSENHGRQDFQDDEDDESEDA